MESATKLMQVKIRISSVSPLDESSPSQNTATDSPTLKPVCIKKQERLLSSQTVMDTWSSSAIAYARLYRCLRRPSAGFFWLGNNGTDNAHPLLLTTRQLTRYTLSIVFSRQSLLAPAPSVFCSISALLQPFHLRNESNIFSHC